MSMLISGCTLIDGVADGPRESCSILITEGRIDSIGTSAELDGKKVDIHIDASGKYVIPGLMDTNVHLSTPMFLEEYARYEGRYEDLTIEGAQVALRNGLTTVFDTWGPREVLTSVRDRINRGEVVGSRIMCAGNIVGLDGPFSENFFPKLVDVASSSFLRRVNTLYAESVGAELTWLPPEQVAERVRAYTASGIDFVKYASSDHRVPSGLSAYLTFSGEAQAAIVREAHRAGLTAQAHSTSVEGLRVAVEAGCDIIQHCNLTGPVPIPDSTFELLLKRGTACTVLPFTERHQRRVLERGDPLNARMYSKESMEVNVRNLVRSGVKLLLATDSIYFSAEALADPSMEFMLGTKGDETDNLYDLGSGHFHWFKAMEEVGFPPMEALRAATRNIAAAFNMDNELGTVGPGKIADMIILDRNPLEAARNYGSIHAVIKGGRVVDRSTLPEKPMLRRTS